MSERFMYIVVMVTLLMAVFLFSFLVRTSRIFLDQENKKIVGVCAGLSRASDMPVWLIRAFFLVFILFFGYGLFFYLVLWLFMPVKRKNVKVKKEVK